MKKKIVAITGGSGFVGQKLIEANLLIGNKVKVLSRRHINKKDGVEYFKADLCNSQDNEIISNFIEGSQILYHCASELKDENKMYNLHLNGTKRLIHLSMGKIEKWIQLSSVGAYGSIRNGIINEQTIENPVNLYEKTKLLSDKLVINSGLNFVILRPSIIFDKNMKSNLIKNFAKLIKKRIFFYLDKTALMNFVHLEDLINALILCANHKKALGKTFIISEVISMQELIKSLSKGLGLKEPQISLSMGLVRLFVKLTENLQLHPLTTAKIDAITRRASYDSSYIKSQIGFSFNSNLSDSFRDYAKLL